ncbi:toll/interleukin-1 receptor domain-containing protein [Stutzerimonas nitrititolerans]|uniref:toll/interleukin-1 receptor domain-containing protein n=1 Tax=Stutzerimonas nitrititolerans TaxID=2482751 RepID=UPI0019560161|nr:toll/interleukin-1 receptor domain-containing protein [Stutzerimonas nitrititolerans]
MISSDSLRNASYRRSQFNTQARSIQQAKSIGQSTIFLCHSHKDQAFALGFAQLLQDAGCRVYIDWLDGDMPERPNKETAARIQQKINENEYFVYLATGNSSRSRWCPWEIGYADGVKVNDKIVIAPTRDNSGSYGQEYLDLYRRIDVASDGHLAVFDPNSTSGHYARNIW